MKKFLEFNGKAVYFLAKDGTYWIAIKPICEALGVNYNRQFQEIKKDEILSQVFALEQMVGGDNRLRKMVSLPEFYVYGWIFGIQSDSKDLKTYKWKCYEVLYNYFHGTITQRAELLRQRHEHEFEIRHLETKLFENKEYKRLQELRVSKTAITKGLNSLDISLAKEQLDLFKS